MKCVIKTREVLKSIGYDISEEDDHERIGYFNIEFINTPKLISIYNEHIKKEEGIRAISKDTKILVVISQINEKGIAFELMSQKFSEALNKTIEKEDFEAFLFCPMSNIREISCIAIDKIDNRLFPERIVD